jgi:hypothetical protein
VPYDTPDADAETRRLAEHLRRIIGRLTTVRPPASELASAADAAAEFADRLDALQGEQRLGEIGEAGLLPSRFVDFSAISGRANPIAPPLRMQRIQDGDGHRVEGEVVFGQAYEGPPGHVHGGFIAAVYDEVLGFAQAGPGYTGWLKVTYRNKTPLHQQLRFSAALASTDGRKRIIRGTCHLGDTLLSEAEGLFIAPRDGIL